MDLSTIFMALLLGCLSPALAQKWTTLFPCPLSPMVPGSTAPGPGGIICTSVNVQSKAIGRWAVSKVDPQATALVGVLNYGTQVVAGTNHFATIVYRTGSGSLKVVQVEVFKDLAGAKTLTSSQVVPTSQLKAPTTSNTSPTPLFKCGPRGQAGGLSCRLPDSAATASAQLALDQINSQGAFTFGPATMVGVISPYAVQVVAGINYFTTLAVATTDGVALVQSSVYKNLQQQSSLTKWQLLSSSSSSSSSSSGGRRLSGSDSSSGAPLFQCSSPRPGTYSAGGISCKPVDATARAVAAFAVAQLNGQMALPNSPVSLAAISLYGTQVVAGTNYFLQLQLTGSRGQPSNVQVRVFEPLPYAGGAASRQLTGWALV